ncbi:MAG TPA: O-antigen ligase family protein, partial [Candidatus Binatus sp.]|nr:O-antigen ligase family protein [Candidatus Binatus sp.]
MSPLIALTLCILFIIYLYIDDFRREPKVSQALWIPLIWFLVDGSRSLTEWMGYGLHYTSVEDYAEGSPIDRNVSVLLAAAGIFILVRRKLSWSQIVRLNGWMFIFMLFCGISILWSDFSLIAAKRWVKAAGVLVMVLVVLTDQNPVGAIKALIRRWAYVLIPLSLILIKYFGELGRSYDRWTGQVFYSGVGTDKNALGYLCLICGFFYVWSLLTMWRHKILFHDKKETLLTIFFLALTSWLLYLAQSATSLGVLLAGICILVLLDFNLVKRNPNSTVMIGIVIASILFWAFDVMGMILGSLNRDVTLTGRTELWKDLMEIGTNPLIGTGYESFWLGDGAKTLWIKYWWH